MYFIKGLCHYTQYLLSLPHHIIQQIVGIPFSAIQQYINDYTTHLHHKRGRPYKLSPSDEVIIFLIFFRHYPVDIFLASIFELEDSHVYNIHSRMLDWFYDATLHALSPQTLEWRQERGVRILNTLFTYIVDGSEQEVSKPNSTVLDTYFYSGKKDMHSINTVLFVAMDGTVLMKLKSDGGSFNDDNIMNEEEQKKKWQAEFGKESGLGDSGFSGMGHLGLYTVPDTQNDLYYLLSSYRIIVENTLADIKDFRFCGSKLRVKIDDSKEILIIHHKGWSVGCSFVNLYREKKKII